MLKEIIICLTKFMYPINLNNFPDGFELIDDKVKFDPKKHLRLEKPSEIYTLKDLGYSEEVINNSLCF